MRSCKTIKACVMTAWKSQGIKKWIPRSPANSQPRLPQGTMSNYNRHSVHLQVATQKAQNRKSRFLRKFPVVCFRPKSKSISACNPAKGELFFLFVPPITMKIRMRMTQLMMLMLMMIINVIIIIIIMFIIIIRSLSLSFSCSLSLSSIIYYQYCLNS